jgi:Protein of unknown function (DUF3987)/Primase C terminal 2 (PriCT-2)
MDHTIETTEDQGEVKAARAHVDTLWGKIQRGTLWGRIALDTTTDNTPLFEDEEAQRYLTRPRWNAPIFEIEEYQQYYARHSQPRWNAPIFEDEEWQQYHARLGQTKPRFTVVEPVHPLTNAERRVLGKLEIPRGGKSSQITVTFFPSQFAQSMKVKVMTLEELRDLIQNTSKTSKKKLPWLKFASFDGERTEANCLRSNTSVTAIHGVELDYDREKLKLDEAIAITKKAKLKALLYTSASYTEAKPRWRILLPASKPLPPSERLRMVARVHGLFGGVFSGESFTLSQSYYFGSVNNNPAHRAVVTEGRCIDLCGDLDAGALDKNNQPVDAAHQPVEADPYNYSSEPIGLIEAALNAIPNTAEIDRAQLFDVGQSVYSGTGGSGAGLAAFIAWTESWKGWELEKDRKNCAAYTTKVWRGMKPHSVTIGTLYDLANKATPGWREACDEQVMRIVEKRVDEEMARPRLLRGGETRKQTTRRVTAEINGAHDAHLARSSDLFDPWAQYIVPDFPLDVLPPAVQEFVASQAEVIGIDRASMAMCVIGAFSAALNHSFGLKMMRHGDWFVSPRLWVLLLGDSSTKKTAGINAATKPLEDHQADLQQRYREQLNYHEIECANKEGPKPDKPEEPQRFVVWNTTPDKLGELLSRSDRGLLVKSDELAGWIGSMEKYGNSKAGMADRAFWLKAHDGGSHGYDRIGRGSIFINNLSVSMIGGIQPRRLAELKGLTSDGLLQRFIPTVMGPAHFTIDRPTNTDAYDRLMLRLIEAEPDLLTLSDPALELMNGLRLHLHQLSGSAGGMASGFQSFVGKMEGMAGGIALILHMVAGLKGTVIGPGTVEGVSRVVKDFILPHALEFYRSAESATDGDRLKKLASWILTHNQPRFVASDLTSEVADFRGISLFEVNERVSPLVAAGWVVPENPRLGPGNRSWKVNANVHTQFASRMKEEEASKAKLAELMNSPRRKL